MFLLSAAIMIAMFIPVSISMIFMPYLTRETVSFGVSVSEEIYHSAALRRMRKQYAWISAALNTILLAVSLIGILMINKEQQPLVITGYILLTLLGSAVISLGFYAKMKKFKASLPPSAVQNSVIAVDTGFRSSNKLVLSNKWFLIHIAVTLISTALAIAYYDKFPNTLNMKFDYQGNVTRTAEKSYRTVLGMNLMQVVMIAVFMVTNWMILKSKQQIDPGNPQQSVQRNAAFRRRWSMFNVASGLMMVLLFSFIQLNMIYPLNPEVMLLVSLLMPGIIVVLAIVLSFTTGQGGRRIGGGSAGTGTVPPVNDDKYWKLGGLYFNPRDPSMFVEKRMGIGWTINFASTRAWIILIGIIAVTGIVSFVVS